MTTSQTTNFGQLVSTTPLNPTGYFGAGTLFANVLSSLSPGQRLLLNSYSQLGFFIGTGGSNQNANQVLTLGYSNSTFGGPLQFQGYNTTSFQFIPSDSLQTIYLGSNYYTYINNDYQSKNTTLSNGFQYEQSIFGQKTIRSLQGIWTSPGSNQSNLSSLVSVPHSLLTQNGTIELQSSNLMGPQISLNNIMYPSSNQWNWAFVGPSQDGSLLLNYNTTTYTGNNSNSTTTQFLQANSNGLIINQSISVPIINSSQSNPLISPLTFNAQQYLINLYGNSGIQIQQNATNTAQTIIKGLNSNSLQIQGTDLQNSVQISSTQIYQQTVNNVNQQVFRLDPSSALQAFYFSNTVNFQNITAPSLSVDNIAPYTVANNQVIINSDLVVTGKTFFRGDIENTTSSNLNVEDNIINLARGQSNATIYDGTANDQSGLTITGIISNVTDTNVYQKNLLWRYNGGINAGALSNRSYWQLEGGGLNIARYIPSQSNMVQYQQAIDDDQSLVISQITSNGSMKIFQMGILPSNLIYT